MKVKKDCQEVYKCQKSNDVLIWKSKRNVKKSAISVNKAQKLTTTEDTR